MTFNGKAKTTSQFFYDLKKDSSKEIYQKFMGVVDEYFAWYATFANQDSIKEVKMFSSDFVCENKCSLGGSVQMSVVDLVIPKEIIMDTLGMFAEKHAIPLDPKIQF